MIDFTKKEIDFINELISKHWVYNNTCHKENRKDFELSLELVKKLSLFGVVKSFTAEQVGDMLANKFTTIEEAIHYFDTIE